MSVSAPAPSPVPAPVPTPAAAPAASRANPPRHSAAETSAQEFEAVFLGQMTQLMMESVETDDAFSGGHGEAVFRGVLAEKLGTEIARTGGIGLAPAVMAQIIKMQEGTGNGD